MKKITSIKKAYTMTELVITMIIIGFLATVTTVITSSKLDRLQKYYYYAAYTTLTSLASEIIIDSDDGLISKDADLCSEFESRLNLYPDDSDDIQSCDEDHSSQTGTDFSDLTPNIITRNGMKFYNLSTSAKKLTLLANDEVNDEDKQGFIIYIDIDGDNGNTVAYEDVFPFYLTLSGKVIPAYASTTTNGVTYYYGGNSTDAMVFSVRYETVDDDMKLTVNWLVKGVSFQEAACKSGYINSETDYCNGYDIADECNTEKEEKNKRAACILVPLKPIKYLVK